MRFIALATSAMWLFSGQAIAADTQPFEPTESQVSDVEHWISERLSDPWSAEFVAPIAAQDSKGRVYFCGLVNAKNKMGGYTGYSPYFVMASSVAPLRLHPPMMVGDYEVASIVANCRTHGLRLRRP